MQRRQDKTKQTLIFIYTLCILIALSLDITPDSPLWVGAWWLGFLVSAAMALLVVVPMFGFPKHLPGKKV